MTFHLRLHSLREEKNLKQKDLAKQLNLKPCAISKYEKCITRPSMETLVRMAEILACSLDYLLGLSTVKNPYGADDFSPKEAEIIRKYRKLSRENQIRIDERISAMLDGQQNAK